MSESGQLSELSIGLAENESMSKIMRECLGSRIQRIENGFCRFYKRS